MTLRRLATYWAWFLLGLVAGLCVWVYCRTEEEYNLLSRYLPGWLFAISVGIPLLGAVYFTRRYNLYSDTKKNVFGFRNRFPTTLVAGLALAGFVGLLVTVPRLMLLALDNGPLPIEELDVVYVHKRFRKGTYTGTRVGIQYGDTLLQFDSSRRMYFLLAGQRCIRAEIGQVAPGFYFVRNLQFGPGEQAQARNAYWQNWRSRVGRGIVGTGTFMLGIGAIILAGWLLSQIPGVKNRFRKINK